MKFIHCADIHLDSPLRGLTRYQDAPVEALRHAGRRAFENLVDLALREQVAFVLIAGDLYDGNWQDFNTGLFFVHQTSRLARPGIDVYVVRGNHDADSRLTRSLPLPPNVHVFSSRKAETRIHAATGVAIHGQSFAEAAVTSDLAAGYPTRRPGTLNVGVLHTSVNGREGHADYAPCSLDTLLSKGYDYWALGHVHRREVLHEDPWVVFPGNLQGRHARETGAKGCELVTVEDGRIVSVEPRAVDALRWHVLDLDARDCPSAATVLLQLQDGLCEALQHAEGRPLAVRVRIGGRTSAHLELCARSETFKQEVRALSLSCGEGELWIEKILLETQPSTGADLAADGDETMGELLRLLQDLEHSPGLVGEMSAGWQDLMRRLPPELVEGDDAMSLAPVLRDVATTLIPRLLEATAR